VQELRATAAALRVHREINQTARPYPDSSSLKELFETCVTLFPTRIAAVCGSESLSYRELNGLANSLAELLRHAGIVPGDRVAVLSERSTEVIVSLVAIIKCGASYLPVDVSWPAHLLNGIMSSFGCGLVLARKGLHIPAECTAGRRVVEVSLSEMTSAGANPDVSIDAEAIAYVNFTSGTTGTPKGVPIRHRSIARLVFDPVYAPLDHTSVLLHVSPVTFDAATFEIWGALLRGGTCVIYPWSFLSFSRLKAVIERTGVSAAFITTALFNAVIDEAPTTLDTVATILTGGERYSYRHVARALERYGPGRVVHVYGPTECTTFATSYPIYQMSPDPGGLPIGRPIQNTRLYVVTDNSLCPPGTVGEIMLSGPGLSPGYLGSDGEGATAFAEYDVQGMSERVHRTGDYGFLLESGDLVFTGRRDDQMKVNGFRITLAEISQALDGHPNVRQSYVTVSKGRMGERVLAAFVVPLDGERSATGYREHLRARLPAYMVPSVICCCERLPLTASGKVDRQELLRQSPVVG
jgi:D-alanine--poly(phosphoribitol) ligase subunit 1